MRHREALLKLPPVAWGVIGWLIASVLCFFAGKAAEFLLRQVAAYLEDQGASPSTAWRYTIATLNSVAIGGWIIAAGIGICVFVGMSMYQERFRQEPSIYRPWLKAIFAVAALYAFVFLWKLVPTTASWFEQHPQFTPSLKTQILIVLSNFIGAWWWLLILGASVLILVQHQKTLTRQP